MNKKYIGSTFDSFLKEEGIYDEVNREAKKRVKEMIRCPLCCFSVAPRFTKRLKWSKWSKWSKTYSPNVCKECFEQFNPTNKTLTNLRVNFTLTRRGWAAHVRLVRRGKEPLDFAHKISSHHIPRNKENRAIIHLARQLLRMATIGR